MLSIACEPDPSLRALPNVPSLFVNRHREMITSQVPRKSIAPPGPPNETLLWKYESVIVICPDPKPVPMAPPDPEEMRKN